MIRRDNNVPAGQALIGGFSFALLAGLAILSLLIVVMGARVYRSIEDAAAQNYQSRTVLSYIAGKVRATDAAEAVSVEALDGRNALVLSEEFDGIRYNTYIYLMNGGLCECFVKAGSGLDPALGDRLVDIAGFTVSKNGNVLHVSVTDSAGNIRSLSLCLQSGGKERAA